VLLRAMDRAGIGYGEDDEIRIRSPLDRPWMWATGPRVRDLLENVAKKLPAIEGVALCPRCAREQMWIDLETRVRLTVVAGEGSAPFEIVETETAGDVEWQRDWVSWCPACGWKGTLGDVMALAGVADTQEDRPGNRLEASRLPARLKRKRRNSEMRERCPDCGASVGERAQRRLRCRKVLSMQRPAPKLRMQGPRFGANQMDGLLARCDRVPAARLGIQNWV
jgi:hypothetical protein